MNPRTSQIKKDLRIPNFIAIFAKNKILKVHE